MANVDDRIVQMDFNNRNFESGVATSLSTLDKLKKALTFGKTNGLDDIDKSAQKLNLAGIGSAVDTISSRFSALGIVGVTALVNIANKAVNAGEVLVKSLTVDPIKAGLANYETQINAIQTILANTSASGTTLGQVNASLKELNTYANLTVYNFSEMAKNIGTFTAAGVDLKTSTAAIKGIANLAAFSGASSDQASTAMYQLSQAISSGTVKLQDWNSVVNAGLGGKTFQNALITTAKVHGVNVDAMIKKDGSFRNSLQEGWITSKVLTETLSQFTGDLSAAQLKSLGYSDAQAASILKTGKIAVGAATKIKTLTQLHDALKEEVATAYASIFKSLFGDINQATDVFSKLHTVAENALTNPVYAINTLLEGANKLGFRTHIIDAFANAFKAIASVVKPIKEAFRSIFPPETSKELAQFALGLDRIMQHLILTPKAADAVKRTFAGLFAVLHIGESIIKGVLTVLGDILGTFLSGSGGVIDFTAHIGDTLVAFDKFLTGGGKMQDFFSKLGRELIVPIRFLGQIRDAFLSLFSGFNSDTISTISDKFQTLGEKLTPAQVFINKIKNAFSGLGDELSKVSGIFKPAIDAIGNAFSQLGSTIGNAISSGNFDDVLKIVQTGLLGGIVLLVKKFLKNGIKVDVGGGFLGKIGETFEALTGSLKAMTLQLKAKALLEIGVAIALIVASVAVLATIDAKKMNQALQGLGVGFGELLTGMAVLTKVTGAAGIVKLPAMAAALILLSGAILVLVTAVKLMATMSWDEIKKGLTGVGLLLAGLSATALILSKSSASMVAAGIGIAAIAVAMNILFGAVKLFSTLSWKDMLKGLTGVIGSLLGIAAAMRLMPKGMVLQAAAILVIATALQALYLAVKQFSGLNWAQMGKGLVGVAGSLTVIAGAMHLMPTGMVLQAGALVIISGALLILGKALENIGNLSWKVIGKGLTGIAGALGELALALTLMDGTLSGAAAVFIVAKALTVLVPVLQALATMKWGDIGKGIAALAAALGVLVVAGLASEAVIPGLLALGVAALGLGAGLALAGLGIKAIASGLGVLAKTGSKGVDVLLKAFAGFIAQIPAVAVALANGLVQVLKIIGDNGPTIVKAFQTILDSLLTAIIAESPKLAVAVEALITAILTVLVDKAPDVIAAGLQLLVDLLTGIRNNIGQVVALVAEIIVNLLNALASHIGEIVAAGANLIVQLLSGIAAHIGEVISAAGDVIVAFVTGMGAQFGKVASAAGEAMASFIGGLSNAIDQVVAAGANLIIKFIDGMTSAALDIVNAAGNAVLAFLDGLDSAINKYEPQIISECIKIGEDIIKGVIQGVKNKAGGVVDSIKNTISRGLHDLNPSNWGSPARCLGEPIVENLIEGINGKLPSVSTHIENGVTDALNKASKTLGKLPNPLEGMVDLYPTITPVLDLTQVKKDAGQLANLTKSNVTPITTATSFVNAKVISAAQEAARKSETATDVAVSDAPVVPIQFVQNNNSPKSLSTLEVYRQTKNLLGQTRTLLGVPVAATADTA